MGNVPPIPPIPPIPQVNHEAKEVQNASTVLNGQKQHSLQDTDVSSAANPPIGRIPAYTGAFPGVSTPAIPSVDDSETSTQKKTTSSNTKEALGIPKEFRITWIPFALSPEDADIFDAFADHFDLKKIDIGRAWIEELFAGFVQTGQFPISARLLEPGRDYGVFDPNSPAVKQVKERKQNRSGRSDGFGFNKMSAVKDVEKLKQVQNNVSAIGADIFNALMLGTTPTPGEGEDSV